MMERVAFEELVKDAAANLYDFAALEAIPQIFNVFRLPQGYNGSRAEYIRRLFMDAIEYLRPPGREVNPNSPDARPYLILSKRYIEGLSSQEVAALLAISDRQLRRDQRRALTALAARLWEQLFPGQQFTEDEVESSLDFEIQPEALDLRDMLLGVEKVMQGRVAETGIPLRVEPPGRPCLVQADRVILRQVLVSLCSAGLQSAAGEVCLYLLDAPHSLDLLLEFDLAKAFTPGMAREWVERMGARLALEETPGHLRLRLSLPPAERRVILVVDDQPPAINMFRRYLSRTSFNVVGISQPAQVLAAARSHHPALILLDVMMPQVDGWELLQTIKLDESLRSVPVIVCSAWEEPDMARSLGAVRFLKKPVTQKALLDALAEVGLKP